MVLQGALGEASNPHEDPIGGSGPDEGLWIVVGHFKELLDRLAQLHDAGV